MILSVQLGLNCSVILSVDKANCSVILSVRSASEDVAKGDRVVASTVSESGQVRLPMAAAAVPAAFQALGERAFSL